MLKIKELHASINLKNILCGINLEIKSGSIHVIMGPNGSGKSTLANVIAGKNVDYLSGNIEYFGKNLLSLLPEERAHLGIFLSFQNPVEINGVSNIVFLKTALNTLRKKQGLNELKAGDLIKLIKDKCRILELDENFLQRSINFGFSGGEKKKNEILQMLMLNPKLALLDEPDSGLDVDALKIVAKGINNLHSATQSILIITHYHRLLDYVIPDYVHVLYNGRIVQSGGRELALEIEKNGYGWIEEKI